MVRNRIKFVSLSAALVLFACAGILFTGCPHSLKKGIVGVWKMEDVPGGNSEFYYCFASDGNAYYADNVMGVLVAQKMGEYSVSGKKLKVAGKEAECSLKGDVLKLKIEGDSATFKRVSSPSEEEIKKAVK